MLSTLWDVKRVEEKKSICPEGRETETDRGDVEVWKLVTTNDIPLLTGSWLQAIAADDSSLFGFLTESWVMIGFLEEIFHFPSQKDSIFQLFMSHAEEDNT